MTTKLIAITGGIGSGKSVASKILATMGYPIYDCDSKAKVIMDREPDIHRRISDEIDRRCISGRGIDRHLLSEIVFSDQDKLQKLNAIVHGAVREDIMRWSEEQKSDIAFVETAILYESGLDAMVAEVWEIFAPEEIRINRVIARSGLSVEEVKARINAQRSTEVLSPHPIIRKLCNDGAEPLLPQIERAMETV